MANVKTTFDPKSLVIANILNAGDTIHHTWNIDEDYQILVTKGSVEISGEVYDAITIATIPAGTKLQVTAIEDSSFLILLRSDNESIVNQIMPEDSTQNYYHFMRDFRPSWFSNGVPNSPPDTIESGAITNLTVSSDNIKSMVLGGWE